MMTIRCPHCNSASVRTRDQVYAAGTSTYRGSSRGSGVSFGLTKSLNPRIWLGSGSHSGKRQSIRAQEAERFPFWPSILAPVVIVYFELYGEWTGLVIIVSMFWFSYAAYDLKMFFSEWVCGKCGAVFVLKDESVASEKPEITANPEPNRISSEEGGKSCSICGDSFPESEFHYGGKTKQSYCRTCNREVSAAYATGGKEAARAFREEKRANWS